MTSVPDGVGERYKVLLFKNRPVADQKRVATGIAVKFHDGGETTVSERDWLIHRKSVFVPKHLGPRCVVVKDWNKYSSLCN